MASSAAFLALPLRPNVLERHACGEEGQEDPHRSDDGQPSPSSRAVEDPTQELRRIHGRRSRSRRQALHAVDEGGEIRRQTVHRSCFTPHGPTLELLAIETLGVGCPAREHLLEDEAQRVDVAGRDGPFAPGLLRAHIGGGAHNGAVVGFGESVSRCPCQHVVAGWSPVTGGFPERPVGVGGAGGAGKTEVQDLDVPGRGHHDVLRFQVPVNDSLTVNGSQDVQELLGDPQKGRVIEPLLQGHSQVATADQLQDQEVGIVAFDVVVELADVGVVELGEDLGFPKESGSGPGLGRRALLMAFTATVRSRRSSTAEYTVPIPPSAMTSTSRRWPIRRPWSPSASVDIEAKL